MPSALTYRFLPSRQPGDGPPPLLVLLHGRGTDERDLLGLAPALDPRLAIAGVRAPYPLGPGFHWYEMIGVGPPEPRSFAAAGALLTDCLTALPTTHNCDPSRLLVLGFSQGAVMASWLVLTAAVPLVGAVLLSGYLPLGGDLPITPVDLAHRPIFVGHGAADPIVPVQWGRQASQTLRDLGATVTYREAPHLPHGIDDEELEAIGCWLAARLAAASA